MEENKTSLLTKNIPLPNFFSRLRLWITGIGSYYVFTYLYDYFAVSLLLIYFGFVEGTIIVMVLSMFVDWGTIKFYDWIKKDWLALETLKELEYKNNFVGKIVRYVHDKNIFVTVVVLSLLSNAFIVTAYMRKGSFQYDGLKKRDWVIFFSSSFLTNLYWVFLIAGGIEVIKYGYNIIISFIKF